MNIYYNTKINYSANPPHANPHANPQQARKYGMHTGALKI